MFALSIVAPVDFNDQAPFPANEIHDVRSKGLLPNEFHSVKRTRTESIPEPLFSDCGITAQPSRHVRLVDFCAAHESSPHEAFAPTWNRQEKEFGRNARSFIPAAALLLPLPACGERVGM